MNATARNVLLLGTLAGAAYVIYEWYAVQQAIAAGINPSDATSFLNDPAGAVGDAVQWLTGWQQTNQGPTWVPVLTQAEESHGILSGVLTAIAYQESHFRESIIRGQVKSSAGALGMMQMLPKYFSSVVRPIPFTDQDVTDQVDQAAGQLVSLYHQLGSWQLAIAGYNAGAQAVIDHGGVPPYTQTQNYVAAVTANVPALAGGQVAGLLA